jgi:hypothetical protein
MARAEKPIDAVGGALGSFAADLRRLRYAAGSPPYRVLSRRARFSASTLAAAASGQRLPSLEVTCAYVAACGGDVQDWQQRWHDVAAVLAAEAQLMAEPAGPGAPPEERQPSQASSREEPSWVRRVFRQVIFSAMGAAVMLIGVTIAKSQLGSRPDRDGPVNTKATPPLSEATGGGGFTAVTGPGCDETVTHNTDQYVPPHWHPWRQGSGSGWTGDGCSGAYLYTDTTGYPDTWANTFTWSFRPAAAGRVRCSLDIFIPDSPGLGFAQYFVYDRNMNEDDRIGSFSIDQGRDRGRWVSEGPYTSPDGTVQPELTDLGLGHHNVAAGPVRVTCAP